LVKKVVGELYIGGIER